MNNPSTSNVRHQSFYAKVYGFLGMGLALSADHFLLGSFKCFPFQLATLSITFH